MSSARILRRSVLSTLVAAAVCLSARQALAGAPIGSPPGLTLTPAGQALFSLDTFATNFPTAGNDPNGIGALDVAVDPFQRVYVTDFANGGVYVFPNRSDGQDASTLAPITQTTIWGSQNADGLAQLGGSIYETGNGNSQVFSLNSSGYKIGNSLWAPWSYPNGIVANPSSTGTYAVGVPGGVDQVHPGLFFSQGGNANVTPVITGTISFMDPVQAALQDPAHPGTGNFVTSGTSLISPNSLAISADGGVLASVWSDGYIRFYSTASIPTSFTDTILTIAGSGSIIMGTGSFSGDMFLSNGGELDMIVVDPTSPSFGTKTILATGGAYGGYLAADPFENADSMYITESGTVYRLTSTTGGSFVTAAVPSAVPEPATMALMGLGGVAILGLRTKRKAK